MSIKKTILTIPAALAMHAALATDAQAQSFSGPVPGSSTPTATAVKSAELYFDDFIHGRATAEAFASKDREYTAQQAEARFQILVGEITGVVFDASSKRITADYKGQDKIRFEEATDAFKFGIARNHGTAIERVMLAADKIDFSFDDSDAGRLLSGKITLTGPSFEHIQPDLAHRITIQYGTAHEYTGLGNGLGITRISWDSVFGNPQEEPLRVNAVYDKQNYSGLPDLEALALRAQKDIKVDENTWLMLSAGLRSENSTQTDRHDHLTASIGMRYETENVILAAEAGYDGKEGGYIRAAAALQYVLGKKEP